MLQIYMWIEAMLTRRTLRLRKSLISSFCHGGDNWFGAYYMPEWLLWQRGAISLLYGLYSHTNGCVPSQITSYVSRSHFIHLHHISIIIQSFLLMFLVKYSYRQKFIQLSVIQPFQVFSLKWVESGVLWEKFDKNSFFFLCLLKTIRCSFRISSIPIKSKGICGVA